MQWRLCTLALTLLTVACGSGAQSTPAPERPPPTDRQAPRADEAGESIAGIELPALPVSSDGMSRQLQAGWDKAEQALAMARPEAPAEPNMQSLQAWSEGPFTQWVEGKVRTIESAEQRLEAAADRSEAERVVGALLVALMYDQFVKQYRGAPVPTEIQDDEELRGIYLSALAEPSEPLANKAAEAYAQCVEAAGEAEPEWRALCARRLNAMQERRAALEDLTGEVVTNAERSAGSEDRSEDIGPPPEGPEVCWETTGAWQRTEREGWPVAERVLLAPANGEQIYPASAPLLEPEREALVEAVHRRLSEELDIEVASLRETNRYLKVWSARRPRPRASQCGRRLRQHEVRPEGAIVGKVSATCRGTSCVLAVHMVESGYRRPEEVPRVLNAALEGPPASVASWTEAANQLEPLQTRKAGLVGAYRAAARERPYVAVETDARLYGAWEQPDAAEAKLKASEDRLERCLQHEPHPLDRYGYVLEVATDGSVASLFPDRVSGQDSRRMHACVRRTLRSVRFDGGTDGDRRAVVVVDFDQTQVTPRDRYGDLDRSTSVRVRVRTVEGSGQRARRSSMLDTSRMRAALASCYDEAFPNEGPTTAHRVALEVSRRGHTAGIELEPIGDWAGDAPPARLERCLKRALRRARWACPTESSSVELETTVCMHRPEQPPEPAQ